MKFDIKGLANPNTLKDDQKKLLKKSYSVLAKTQEDFQTLYKLLDNK